MRKRKEDGLNLRHLLRAEKSGENRELMTKLSPPQRLLPLAKEEGIADCWKEIAGC